MILDRATWDMPVTTADDGMVRVLEEQADRLLARLTLSTDLVGGIRTELGDQLAGGDTGLDATARSLGMSGKTLQRRLTDEGLSFAEIVDEMRLEASKLRLADRSLSLRDVAYLVGFDEQSSFSRAFKRRTGVSPRAYRQDLLPGR